MLSDNQVKELLMLIVAAIQHSDSYLNRNQVTITKEMVNVTLEFLGNKTSAAKWK